MTSADGAVLGTTKVLDHGLPALRWNIAILGEGYRAAELPKYHADVDKFVMQLYGVVPFNEFWGGINVYRVDVTSTDSGADDPAACGGTGAVAAAFFDATFCADGATRRLLYGNSGAALAVS